MIEVVKVKSEVMKVLLELEAMGLVERAGFRNGQIVWRATGTAAGEAHGPATALGHGGLARKGRA